MSQDMAKLPLKFEVEASASPGVSNCWTSKTDDLDPIRCSIPAEFMGCGTGYSPEDLFALALLNCLIAMFKFSCDRGRLTFREVKGRAVSTLDGAPTSLSITHVEIFLDVTGASDVPKVKQALETAIKECPISHSIKSGKSFHLNIT